MKCVTQGGDWSHETRHLAMPLAELGVIQDFLSKPQFWSHCLPSYSLICTFQPPLPTPPSKDNHTEWLIPKEVLEPEEFPKNLLQNRVLIFDKIHSEPGSWKQTLLLPLVSENHILCFEASWRGLKYSFSQEKLNLASYTAVGTASNSTFRIFAILIV